MLYQIISFLLEVATGLLGSACLLRVYMQYQRISFRNPVGSLVFALTDWMVLPLRRVIPAAGGWDLASLLGAFLLKLFQYFVLWLLMGAVGNLLALPVLALFGLVAMAIYGLTGLLIIYAVLSWMQTRSPMMDVIERLCAAFAATAQDHPVGEWRGPVAAGAAGDPAGRLHRAGPFDGFGDVHAVATKRDGLAVPW